MGEAKVIPSLTDQSTRVASFKGLYGGIAIAATAGPVNQPVLISNESDLVKKFTPNNKIEVGFDNAFFSARAFLMRSNKLWVVRAAQDDVMYGAVLVPDHAAGSGIITAPINTGGATAVSVVTFSPVSAGQVLTIGGLTYTAHGTTETTTDEVLAAAFAAGVANASVGTGAMTVASAPVVAAWTRVQGTATNDMKVTFTSVTPNAVATPLAASGTGASSAAISVTSAGAVGTVTGVAVDDSWQPDETDVQTAMTTELFALVGVDPGAWNNDISVIITTSSTALTKIDPTNALGWFTIAIYYKGSLKESWNVNRTLGIKDGYGNSGYIEDVLLKSLYLRAIDNTAVTDMVTLPKSNSTAINLAGGAVGTSATDSEIIVAQNTLTNKEKYSLTIFMDGGWASDAVHSNMVAICAARIDCFSVLSTPLAAEQSSTYMTDVLAYKTTTLNVNSMWAALYTSHLWINDSYNARPIAVAPDGYIGALFSQMAKVYYPCSGQDRGNLSNFGILDVVRNYEGGERDTLCDNNINPIRVKPSVGIVLWGQKTLHDAPSALDRISVVLLLAVIRPAIIDYLESQLFSINTMSNTTGTRALVITRINAFMDTFIGSGCYSYRVVCDDSNNSTSDADNYRLNVWLFIQPTKDVEEIPFETVITSTGVSFDLAASLL